MYAEERQQYIVGLARSRGRVDVTEVVDHDWAKSIYFKDPNGIQLEFCCFTRNLNADDARVALVALHAHGAGHDDYRCFPLDWTPTAPTFVTGADITPGVRAEVHHIIVYLAPPSAAATARAFTPGWPTCRCGTRTGASSASWASPAT